MYTMPARSIAARRCALQTSRVHTPAARPYSLSLARSATSSSVSYGEATSTGPKISSREIRSSSSVVLNSVGDDEVAAAVGERGVAAGEQLGTLLAPGLDVADHAFVLLGGHERAELGLRVEPGPELGGLRRRGEPAHHLVEALGGHEQARAGVAGLAGVEVDRLEGALDRRIDVGVGKDHVRRLAAELERHPLERAAGLRRRSRAPRRSSR